MPFNRINYLLILQFGETNPNREGQIQAAGVEFIDENGGGPGVRLRKRQQLKNSK